MLLNVFGREVEVVRRERAWKAFYKGNEGKKRLAQDIFIPGELAENEIVGYVSDLCHEWACARYPVVQVLKS
ncbi:hypothetical protein P2G88_14945 [Aliiglaciecola sp. CAU 1673]|uniref:DUF7661 family protein n=1 Tax=Aliiglaciecola sp. CAU 1673 TaxID=3032595 RepID=UPI0023DC3AFE|nr:hypothetical protein [Aliiglaciecola sp. CAU 1673]MDF2179548.1 hypothetical protein [Aliiglaciecola sp. CAU 1673]